MWRCPECDEEIEETFDACWACGTSREGVVDPMFQPVADQAEHTVSGNSIAIARGARAGAVVSILMAFVHPFIMLLLGWLAHRAPFGSDALSPTFLFAFVWAPFAAIAGGIAGAIGAKAQTQRVALTAGLLSGVLFHILFLLGTTNAFYWWPSLIVMFTLSVAAFSGMVAGFVGFVVGRKDRRRHVGKGVC